MVSVKLVCAAALLSLALAAQTGDNNAKNGNDKAVASANANNGKANANAKAGNNNNAKANDSKANANNAKNNADAKNNANAKGNNADAKNNANAKGNNADAKKNNADAKNNDAKNNDAKNNNADAKNNNNNADANNNNNNNADANNNNADANNNNNNNNADSTSLLANAVQTGSFSDGQEALGAEAGQAASLTSQNNFINECAGQTLTNGLQITTGSCNGIIMGFIPAKTNMISTILLFPKEGQNIQAGQDFNITLQVNGLDAGSFTNAVATYYAAPQVLNKQGNVIGHTHVTVQDLGNSLNPSQPPDPTQFAFFKGINDAGNGKGLLQATVAGGLPSGNFRVCTLTSASNHQPVIMPVAQRGSQDDCTKFTVSGGGGKANDAASNGKKGQAAEQQAQKAGNQANNNNNNNKNNDAKNNAKNNDAKNNNAKNDAAKNNNAKNNDKNNAKNNNAKQGQAKAQRLARLARRHYVA